MPFYFKFWKQKLLDCSIKSNQVQQRTTKVKGMSPTFLDEKKTTEQIVWKRQNTAGIATWHGISKFVIIIFQDIFFWLSKYEGSGYVLKDDDDKFRNSMSMKFCHNIPQSLWWPKTASYYKLKFTIKHHNDKWSQCTTGIWRVSLGKTY